MTRKHSRRRMERAEVLFPFSAPAMAVFVYGFVAIMVAQWSIPLFPWRDVFEWGAETENTRGMARIFGAMHLVHILLVALMAVQLALPFVFRRPLHKARFAVDVLALLVALMLLRGTTLALPVVDAPRPRLQVYPFEYDPGDGKWWRAPRE